MYYPKSQIQTNLYTKGGELQIVSSQKEYIGFYWKTSKNEYFAGVNPNSGVAIELQPLSITPTTSQNSLVIEPYNKVYNNLKNINTSKVLFLPSYQKPIPSSEDYSVGYFNRYFAKKHTQNLYVEILKNVYNKFKQKDNNYAYNNYLVFNLNWKLNGDEKEVININKKVISTTEKGYHIEGLHSYLNFNYLEFYK